MSRAPDLQVTSPPSDSIPAQPSLHAARQNGIRVTVGLSISGVLLWLMLRSIDLDDLGRTLASASPRWICLALAFYWLEIVVRAYRWRAILRPVRAFSFSQVATTLLVGYSANNVLPARLGELFRADFIRRRYGTARLSAIGTIFIERLLDMIVVIVCAALGMLWALSQAYITVSPLVERMLIAGLLVSTLLVGLAFVLIFVAMAYSPQWLHRRSPRGRAAIDAVRLGLRSVHDPRRISKLVALSVLTWFVNALAIWAILNAVGVALGPAVLMLLIGLSGIAAAIPSAPANLGTLQFAFITVLAAAGFSATVGFAAASLVQVFFLGSVTIVGAVIYGVWSLRAATRGAHGSR